MSSQGRKPNGAPHEAGTTTRIIPTARAPTGGKGKFRGRLSRDVLRHASSGPTAVRNNKSSANGTITLLKKGGPTVILWPWIHSESTGNSVPHSATKQISRNNTLLNRKLDSRETTASSRCTLRTYAPLRT